MFHWRSTYRLRLDMAMMGSFNAVLPQNKFKVSLIMKKVPHHFCYCIISVTPYYIKPGLLTCGQPTHL